MGQGASRFLMDQACTEQEQLELSCEDLLQCNIDKMQRDIDKLKWEIENPKEAKAKEKAKRDA